MQPNVYISYVPGRTASITALFHIDCDADICGWYMNARGDDFSAAFFMLEGFYSKRASVLHRSLQDEVYGSWTTLYPPTKNKIRDPIPEWLGHELERIQSKLVQEWLFFKNDPYAAADHVSYRSQGLPIHAVNIKSRKLHRFEREDAMCVHATPGTDLNIVEFVQTHWQYRENLTPR
jgi:hypothetical protein